MSSMMNDDTLAFVRVHILSRYIYLIVFGVGLVGNSLNLLVFFRKKFRSNSCSIYFIVYSLNNYLILIIGVFVWSLTNGFLLQLENQILIWCKIRRYFAHITYLFGLYLLTVASINRYARVREAQFTQNCHRYVFLCERRTTVIIIALLAIFCLVINLHVPFLFEIEQVQCYARDGVYRIFYHIFVLVFYGLCPIGIAVVINVATISHIRSIRRLIYPTIPHREFHLIRLVIAHSIFNTVLTFPYLIIKFVYYTYEKASPPEAIKLVYAIALLATYLNHSFSFFLYTLTTSSFRRELKRAFSDCITKITNKSLCK